MKARAVLGCLNTLAIMQSDAFFFGNVTFLLSIEEQRNTPIV